MLKAARKRCTMTIKINKPELEALIRERMENGGLQDVEDVLLQALKLSLPSQSPAGPRKPKKNFAQFLLESPLPGSGLKLERRKDYPRPTGL
jgi:hypothetical protein